eukprot:9503272-Pyramimonas_sp.AAC.1
MLPFGYPRVCHANFRWRLLHSQPPARCPSLEGARHVVHPRAGASPSVSAARLTPERSGARQPCGRRPHSPARGAARE